MPDPATLSVPPAPSDAAPPVPAAPVPVTTAAVLARPAMPVAMRPASEGGGLSFRAPLPKIKDEDVKRAALRRMKRIALGALVAAAVGFLIVHAFLPRTFWWGMLEAFFEASMVGALADWYAVTALFRHPLGIATPHTAIIPTRKARLGNALGNFVGGQFLSPENVVGRIRKVNFAEIAGNWLETPGHVRGLREKLVGAFEGAVEGLSDDRIRGFATRDVLPRLRDMALAPRLSDLLLGIARDGQHEDLLDELLKGTATVAADNRDSIHDAVKGQVPGFVPMFVVDLVTDAIMARIDATINGMLTDREHPMRARIHARVQDFVERLDTDPEMQAKVDAFRDRILDNPALQTFAVERWHDFKAFLTADLHDPDSAVFAFLEERGRDLGRSMLSDEAFQAAVNEKVAETVEWAIREHGERVPELIRKTLDEWPEDVVSDRIEVLVGKDLQYIRLNGTVVGGLVGVLLYLLTTWIG